MSSKGTARPPDGRRNNLLIEQGRVHGMAPRPAPTSVVARRVDDICDLIAENGEDMTTEEVEEALKLTPRELAHALAYGRKTRVLRVISSFRDYEDRWVRVIHIRQRRNAPQSIALEAAAVADRNDKFDALMARTTLRYENVPFVEHPFRFLSRPSPTSECGSAAAMMVTS
jgi:hypothetical protein